ncbi:MAG: NAD-binding protein [Chloroflexi bacterium]|nr:NAD-binding protein [Chloroflexota bacterium]
MKSFTLRDRIRYRFDNLFARGTVALIVALAAATALLIFIVSLIVVISGVGATDDSAGPDLFEMMWRSLLRTLDPGTMGGDSGSPGFLGASLIVTLVGIFITSILIGIVTSGIERQLDGLRRGRSLVVERDHVVILGWSPQIFSIIDELMEANASRRDACIVVMTDMEKPEMEEQIAARVRSRGHTRVVCRTGNPLDVTDLDIVNPNAARAILILSPENGHPDLHIIKSLLAVVSRGGERSADWHIVTQVSDARNLDVTRMVSDGRAQLVLEGDLISRIMVQTSRQAGLSAVYSELLSFEGNEIYFRAEPALAGCAYRDAQLRYADASIVGVARAGGPALLNPAPDTRIEAGDRLIMIAADDSLIALNTAGPAAVDPAALATRQPRAPEAEHTLILGWNHRGAGIIRQLDQYAQSDSLILVVADDPDAQTAIARDCADLKRQTVTFQPGQTTDRRVLDALDIASFSHVMVLSYSDALPTQEADAQTLVTLLHLRDIRERGGRSFSVVSEMLDLRNRRLAEVAHADDYIVSDHLVSLIMAQLVENPQLSPVFDDLFDPEGAEIYLKPAEDYVQPGRPVDFYTVTAAAARYGESAIGYRLQQRANDVAQSYGVVLNPRKSERVTFAHGDKLIVVAEA